MPPRARTPYLDHDGPLAMAHRGFDTTGLENSMRAFAAAVGLGASYLETDVHATADGRLVAFHDDALDRVTDATGRIADLAWSRVSRARIGGTEPVPLLEDLLGAWPDVRINIDVKAQQAVLPLVDVVERTGCHDRVCVTSFSDRRRRSALRRLSRPVATSGGVTTTSRVWLAARAGAPTAVLRRLSAGVDCLQVPPRAGPVTVVTRRVVAALHAAELHVHVWTVDEEHEMVGLLDLGVDGVITDRVDVALQVLRTRAGGPP